MNQHLRFILSCLFCLSILCIFGQKRKATQPSLPAVEKGVTKRLAEKRAANISLVNYDLTFRIPADIRKDVSGTVVIDFFLKDRIDVVLDFQGRFSGNCTVNGMTGQAKISNEHIIIPKKLVKKGTHNAEVEVNGQVIEVVKEEKTATMEKKIEAAEKQVDEEAPKLVFGKANGPEPLIVIDGKVATVEQLKALDPKVIDNMSVVKNEESKAEYARRFNADTSNGILFIETKDYVSQRDSKDVVEVSVTVPEEKDEEEPYDMVEQKPEFPGGVQGLMQFLSATIHYPVAAQTAGKQGRVVVQFVVEADGTVSSAKVVRSISEELDAEALRVVNAMPRWTPGKHKGKAVRVKYTLPVSFRLTPKQSAPATTEAKPQV